MLCSYGVQQCEAAKARLENTIRRYQHSNAYCHMFGRLWGLFNPVDEDDCQFYLAALSPLIDARSGSETYVIALPKSAGHMVRVQCVLRFSRWRIELRSGYR